MIGRRQAMSRLRTLFLACLLFGASAGTVMAESPEAESQARRLFETAETHFRSGLFAEALAKYQAGYEIHPLPGFLINIAQCYRRLGDLSLAQATYRKFIMVAPDSPFVPQVKALIAELEALNKDLNEKGAGHETAPPVTPPPQDVTPEPSVREELVPSPPPVPSETSPDLTTAVSPEPVAPAKTRWWLWGLLGAGVAGAITTIVLVSLPAEKTTLHEGSLGTMRR